MVVIAVSVAGAAIAAPEVIRRPFSADCFRVATYNIHGGYSQFFDPNLERVAQLIELDGVDVALLQEVETGRMASFGVDQVLWLARRLRMESTFFPQNEALQGLAVLSRVPIAGMEGLLLPSEANQAAAMSRSTRSGWRTIRTPRGASAISTSTTCGSGSAWRSGMACPSRRRSRTRTARWIRC